VIEDVPITSPSVAAIAARSSKPRAIASPTCACFATTSSRRKLVCVDPAIRLRKTLQFLPIISSALMPKSFSAA